MRKMKSSLNVESLKPQTDRVLVDKSPLFKKPKSLRKSKCRKIKQEEYNEILKKNIQKGTEIIRKAKKEDIDTKKTQDVIVSVDGRNIKTVPELQEVVGRAKEGDVLVLTINRKGDTKEIEVRLKAG